jgi:hypothetical protein
MQASTQDVLLISNVSWWAVSSLSQSAWRLNVLTWVISQHMHQIWDHEWRCWSIRVGESAFRPLIIPFLSSMPNRAAEAFPATEGSVRRLYQLERRRESQSGNAFRSLCFPCIGLRESSQRCKKSVAWSLWRIVNLERPVCPHPLQETHFAG